MLSQCCQIMNVTYNKQGVNFVYPATLELIEENFGDEITSIVFESIDSDVFIVDVYKTLNTPSLHKYLKNHLDSFLNELPIGFKLFGDIQEGTEKRLCLYGEILANKLEFTIKTILRYKVSYVYLACMYEHQTSAVILSAQLTKENYQQGSQLFDSLLLSFNS